MTSCSLANHDSDSILLADEAVEFSIKAEQIFNSQSSSFGIILNRQTRPLQPLNLFARVRLPSSARRTIC